MRGVRRGGIFCPTEAGGGRAEGVVVVGLEAREVVCNLDGDVAVSVIASLEVSVNISREVSYVATGGKFVLRHHHAC